MKGGNRNKKGKPLSNNKMRDRSPLSENRETVAVTNSNSISNLDDNKISTLQHLNSRLIRDIATLRGEKDDMLRKEKEAQDAHFENEKKLNEEIANKEDKCRAMIEEKNCLKSSFLQFKEQSEADRSSLEAERAELLSKLQEEALMSLSAKVAEVEKQVEERLKEEFEKEILKKENESQAAIYEVKESVQVLKEDIIKKEEECQALLSERKDLKANILLLEGKMQSMLEETETSHMFWEFEKSRLSSQVATAESDIEEMGRSHERLQKVWEADKESLLSALCKSEEKAADSLKQREVAFCQLNQKYEEMCIESESLKFQLKESNDLLVSMKDARQSQIALSATNTQRLEALLIENRILEQTANSLQQKVTEGGKQYSELNKQYQESENSLKQQVEWLQKDIDSTRSLLEIQKGTVEELSIENAGLNNKIQELKRSLEEMQGTHAKVVEEKGLLNKEFELLHTEFIKKCSELNEKKLKMLKENENHRKLIESLDKEKAFLESEKAFVVWSLEEATQRSEENQEKHFHSNRRVLDLEDQISELHTNLAAASSINKAIIVELNNIKDDGNKKLRELSIENAQLKVENQQLSKSLGEATTRFAEIQGNFLHSSGKVLDLEDQVSELCTEVAAARSAYDSVTAELSKIKEDTKKQANEFCKIKEEKDAIHGDLTLQISRNKELEQDLLSANSLFKKVWESACMAEGRVANLQSQFSAFEEDKKSQSSHFLGQLPVFAEVLSGELSDLQYQVSKLAEEKHCLEEKNNSLQEEMARLHLSSEGRKNQEGIDDNFDNDIRGRDIRAQQSLPKHQYLGAAENKKWRNMHFAWSAWVVSAGALAVTLAAYLKFSK